MGEKENDSWKGKIEHKKEPDKTKTKYSKHILLQDYTKRSGKKKEAKI